MMNVRRKTGFVRMAVLWLLAWTAAAGFFFYRSMPQASIAGAHAPAASASAVKLCSNQTRTTAGYRTKNIEDVQVGDYVLAKDPGQPGDPTPRKVLATPVNYTHHVVHIQVSQAGRSGGELQATREHPFFTSNRGWVNAKDLQEGDQLQDTQGNMVSVRGIQVEEKTCDTFNLTVDGVHTFYVLAGDTPAGA